ncbi:hypothetical protein PPYR_01016 [Photinus pyralis]|uniref:Major facilitator superfamily (MFS) profile domain-containing protein n=3 Tax=Photinus pyralis TaxID=7054 RepID=A0A5N4B3A1_PHOPY|nr:proton-coupled folate transporter-like isoform X1 [Photinus pyralis]KAB0804046.1 hypothetical protein PPYR_01016 [Photinus pyralis]
MELTQNDGKDGTTTEKTSMPFAIKEKARLILSNITVEPLMFLFLFPSVLMILSVANLDLEKACRVNLKFNDTICDALSTRNKSLYTPEHENAVQKLVTGMNAWKSVIKSVIPACLLLIVGAWSDRHNRRKPLMGLPIIGECITVTGFILCTYFFYELPMEVTGFFESVPTSLTGGWFTMFMAIYSYISSVSTIESRTTRIGALKICAHGSIMIGMALSGVLYRFIGLYGIFCGALLFYVSGFIYLMVVVKEKDTENITNYSDGSRWKACKDFFNFGHIKSTFIVAFKQREKNYRTRVFVILILIVLTIGPMHGEISVVYLFARKQFQWNEVQFSMFYSVNVVLHIIGTVIALALLCNYFKLHDSTVGMICYIGKFFSGIMYAFAKTPLLYCLGVVVEMLSATTFITVKAMATKLVSEEEQGKLNALIAILEALTPLVFGLLYNLVYRSTIDILPGAFYIVASVVWIPVMILFGWLYVQEKRDARDVKQT